MSFIWPAMLWLLVVVPVLVVGYLRLGERRKRSLAELGTMGLLQTRSGTPLGRRRHVPPLLFLLGVVLLLVGLARPEVELHLPRREGTVILAFDVSNSMIATDLAPSRIAAAKRAAREFVTKQPSSIKIGVVAFSSAAFIVQPPTDVKSDVLASINRLSPEGGTSLGQAILTSLSAIAGKPIAVDPEALAQGVPGDVQFLGSAVVVMLTDGEDTSGLDPLVFSDVASRAGVRLYPIGIGRARGTVVTIDGFKVSTHLDEGLLRDLAARSNGRYFRARDAAHLSNVYSNIDLQLTLRGEKTEVTSVFAGAGLLLFLIGGTLSMLWLGRVP